jgi:hypothetical protein
VARGPGARAEEVALLREALAEPVARERPTVAARRDRTCFTFVIMGSPTLVCAAGVWQDAPDCGLGTLTSKASFWPRGARAG